MFDSAKNSFNASRYGETISLFTFYRSIIVYCLHYYIAVTFESNETIDGGPFVVYTVDQQPHCTLHVTKNTILFGIIRADICPRR